MDLEPAVRQHLDQAEAAAVGQDYTHWPDHRLELVVQRGASYELTDPSVAAQVAEYEKVGHEAYTLAHPHTDMLSLAQAADALSQAKAAKAELARRRNP